jgi:fatty acid-binding protein DegV
VIRLHDGVVSSVTRARTWPRAFETLEELVRQATPLKRLAILHTRNEEAAQQLAAALSDIHPPGPIYTVEVTPVIGVHVGPNALGLGVIRQHCTP